MSIIIDSDNINKYLTLRVNKILKQFIINLFSVTNIVLNK